MKKLIETYLTFAIIILSIPARAQQDAIYSQYMFNMLSINPSYAGNRGKVNITGLTRAQWIGIEGAPISSSISIDAPVKNKNIGLGAQIFNDKIGVTSSSGLYCSYAYRIRLGKSTLSLGIQGGLVHYTANYTQVQTNRNSATVIDKPFQENASVILPGVGTGFFLNNTQYYWGISMPNLFQSQVASSSQIKINRLDDVFAMGGYVISLNENYKLKPSTLVKLVKNEPVELDLNLNLYIFNTLSLGASYRSNDAAVAMMELQVSTKLKIGYAYNQSLSSIRHFHSGSHELMLHFAFGTPAKTPRYF